MKTHSLKPWASDLLCPEASLYETGLFFKDGRKKYQTKKMASETHIKRLGVAYKGGIWPPVRWLCLFYFFSFFSPQRPSNQK